MNELTIGDLEGTTGVPRRTIYFYIQQGILPPPTGAGLAARYHDAHVLRLRAIPRLRALGWRLDQIRDFFQRSSEGDIAGVFDDSAVGMKPGSARKPAAPVAPIAAPPAPPTPMLAYRLAAGVDLFVQRDLPPSVAARIGQLLEAAAAIFDRPDGAHDLPASSSNVDVTRFDRNPSCQVPDGRSTEDAG